MFEIEDEGIIGDKDYYTNYWMAIKDPNDENKTLGIMGI